MSQINRLAEGGLINRSKRLKFSFDGKEFEGFEGDTLASALIANGVSLFGRSFKYHRPRGVLTAGSEEPNALVELRSGNRLEPNTRATTIELFDGLAANSQNRWPSLDIDVLSINSLMAPLLTAGFYYKTFMWPASFWEKIYEPAIRRAAGLGKPPEGFDPDHYEKSFAHCDVLVIGAGPAGISAALAAGRAGARVILCDEGPRLGGRLLSDKEYINDKPALDWVRDSTLELENLANIRILRRTTVFGIYDHGVYGAIERVSDHMAIPREFSPRQRSYRIITKRAILCSGAIERTMVFGDNDRPGIMLGSAVRTYVNQYAAMPGKRGVVVTSSNDGLSTVETLKKNGVQVDAIVDTRNGDMIQHALGGKRVQAVQIIDKNGKTREVECDLVSISNGWNPSLHLTCHLGSRPVWDENKNAFLPGKLPSGLAVAGAAQGRFSLQEALYDGIRTGNEAAELAGFDPKQFETPSAEPEIFDHRPIWRIKASKGKRFVDFQHDVTDLDIELANREGFKSVEHMKRYTTLGMATDQGKTANVAGLAILGEVSNRTISEVGTTIFRPPYTPVTLGALAGHHKHHEFRPTRLTPSHKWASERGAVFVETGLWMRAQYFPKYSGENWLDAMIREVKGTREAAGVCDVSTLGKIDIQGEDAAVFLDRIYTGTFSTLPIGRVRYGLMLREDGFVFDDGTTARLGEKHFLMTTTTAGAAKVMAHLEFCHQVLWPELNIAFTSVTEQWAQYSIAGPNARAVLETLIDPNIDISNDSFSYMACKAITICGNIPARLFRISFSGELAYEIGVPNRYGDALIRALMDVGKKFGLIPYGLEALTTMRIEKGHVAGGELNGQTTPRDLGLNKMVSQKKDCIGKHLSERPALLEKNRPILVGLKSISGKSNLSAGAHFLDIGSNPSLDNDLGHMTSTTYSPTLNCWIGLGLLKNGRERLGGTIRAVDFMRKTDVLVEICDPIFVDINGERLRG